MSEGALAEARRRVAAARRVVVLTGAGVSTESGIPDFRGPNGRWRQRAAAERPGGLAEYVGDEAVRTRAWQRRLGSPALRARPNAGHRALVELERQGRLVALLTQNVDGLHLLAGSDPAKVVELHGTIREVVCVACGARGPAQATLERVRAGEADPRCRGCAGVLTSATVGFGQPLDAGDLRRAVRAVQSCDVLLAVGTSLRVYPVAGLVPLAADGGTAVVIVNGEPTPFDELAVAVVRAPIGAALPAIVGELSPVPRRC